MSTSFGGVRNATLQKLCDSITACLVRPDGTSYPAAPNAFKDRLGNQLPNDVNVGESGREVSLEIRINPDGLSAFAKIVYKTPVGVSSLQGDVNIATLATKLV